MSDRLQKARQALHNSMRGQAAERAVRTLGGHIPAPHLPAGTYTGAYAAQGLRTTNPAAAAQLWESRHPAQMKAGNIPGWVTNAEMGQFPSSGHGSNPFPGEFRAAPPPGAFTPQMHAPPGQHPIHGFGPGGVVEGRPPILPVQPIHHPFPPQLENVHGNGGFNPQELIHLGGGIYLHHPTGTIFGGGGGAVGGGAMNAITNALHSVSGTPAAPAAPTFRPV